MKHLIISLLSFICYSNLSGQNLDNLDNKMGFNKFKLESSYQNYSKDLKNEGASPDSVKYFEYIKGDVKQLFDVNIQEINLGFYKNKLYTINVRFGALIDEDSKDILARLMELFGIPKKSNGDGNSEYEWQFQWNGKKVFMGYTKYSCLNGGNMACQLELFLYSKSISTQIKNAQF